jgi:hypothetical protein
MQLLQAVRNQASKIAAEISDSNLFGQMGDRGTFREGIIKHFLRPFLAECYGLHEGEVFSADGSKSAQIDIVIYDAVFSTVLFRDKEVMLFPAESVFGSIEVKSLLSSQELRNAIENIASLKHLTRPDSDMRDLLPSVRFNVGPGLSYSAEKMNAYLGIVFGYQGISPELVAAELNRRLQSSPDAKQHLPDFIFVTKPAYMIARFKTVGLQKTIQGSGQDYDEFASVPTGDDTLALFYLALNISLSNKRLRSIDFVALWQQLFTEVIVRAFPYS